MIGRRWQFGLAVIVWVGVVPTSHSAEQPAQSKKPQQYEFDNIRIPGATVDEPFRAKFSLRHALDYIDQGAVAWSKEHACVSCHTTGVYLVSRPSLTPKVGAPPTEMRAFFVRQLEAIKATDLSQLRTGSGPTQTAYIAAGLAEWDAHVTKELSPETDEGLQLMFQLQSEVGSYANENCWPPLESSAYHGATVAVMAAATAPGWVDAQQSKSLLAKIEALKNYLRTTPPPHDYGRLLLLWASTRMPGLIDKQRQQDIIKMIWKHQRPDCGWSLRTFAAPEEWGDGSRADKLREESEVENPPSDGHQTGLAVLVLREAGVPANHWRIRRAVRWLLANQRASGRWWTRSLNTEEYHFITFSGTCYPLLALYRCDALPVSRDCCAE